MLPSTSAQLFASLPSLNPDRLLKVSLKAREVLIQCALPSLEERAAQMEHILRSSVVESRYGETGWEHREPDIEVLKEVVDSKYTVFDVLPIFFGHQDPWVSLAALEVYIQKSLPRVLAQEDRVSQRELLSSPFIVSWDFVLRKVGVSEFGMPVHSVYSAPSTPATPMHTRVGNPFFKRVSSISDMSYLVQPSRPRTQYERVLSFLFNISMRLRST